MPTADTRHPQRQLSDLRSVGPATLQDFADLGVTSVSDLATRDPDDLYERLAELKKPDLGTARLDPCCRDVFACAIAQAKDPELPKEQREWWWWSGHRVYSGRLTALRRVK